MTVTMTLLEAVIAYGDIDIIVRYAKLQILTLKGEFTVEHILPEIEII